MTPLRFRARKATGEVWMGSLDEILRHAETVPAWLYEYPDIQKDRSTGFHDKNGKEIFEGDVLRYEYRGPEILIVAFEKYPDPYTAFNDEHCGWRAGNMTLPDAVEYSEVIGTIYENPDLLPKAA